MQNWEAAMEDLTRLRETIDNNVMPRHSEFNTALIFPYIGHNIERLVFQHPLHLSASFSSPVKQTLIALLLVELDF